MTQGLPVSRIINSTVSLNPTPVAQPNLNTMLIMGSSDIIDTKSRIRSYGSLAAVAADFGTSAAEYLAASLFFGQTPQPSQLYIGRWAQVATNGRLLGATLSASQQLLSNLTPLTSSGFKIQVDAASTPVAVTVGSLATVGNLNAVATAINAGLTTASVGATCVWNATQNRFEFKSATTGTTSKVLPLVAPTSGSDLAALIGGETGSTEVDGIAAETAVAAVTVLDTLSTYWYALSVASPAVVDADHQAIAAYIQGAASPHVYGVTTQNTATIDPTQTTDIASVLQGLGYTRSEVQYSSTNPYAVVSILAYCMTVNFSAANSAITQKFKVEPGVTPENLTLTQANALDAKRCNYLATYSNGVPIFGEGVMSGPAYFDEIFGTDWLATGIATDLFNALYAAPKIPQTDAGVNQLVAVTKARCAQAVNNGTLAAGVWSGPSFGAIVTGQNLPAGYYVYAAPIASQASADRSARKSPPIQVAGKLAGAIHSASVAITVNR